MLNRKVKPVNRGYAEQAFSNQQNKGTPLGGLDQNGKMEPGSDNEPDLSVKTSCSETQFKIQHINHEMKKKVL